MNTFGILLEIVRSNLGHNIQAALEMLHLPKLGHLLNNQGDYGHCQDLCSLELFEEDPDPN